MALTTFYIPLLLLLLYHWNVEVRLVYLPPPAYTAAAPKDGAVITRMTSSVQQDDKGFSTYYLPIPMFRVDTLIYQSLYLAVILYLFCFVTSMLYGLTELG